MKKIIKCYKCDYKSTSHDNLRNYHRRHKTPKYICQEWDYKTFDGENFHTLNTVKHGTVILKCVCCYEYSTKSAKSPQKHQERQTSKSINKKIIQYIYILEGMAATQANI